MKISTEIASIANIVGMEKSVELCAKAGFDGWDFSMFDVNQIDMSRDIALARELKKIGLDNGIVCNQSHAPFPVDQPAVRSYLMRSIECTAEAGGEICVVHPDNNKTAEENAEMYAELLPFARSHGVKIAIENMWNWDKVKNESCFAACATSEDFIKHIDILQDDFLVACLDIGHAEMRGSGEGAANMIRALGHRLQSLHIHDNDKWQDSHQIPFSMSIDFDEVVWALKEIHYPGYFTLEVDNFLPGYNESNVFDGVKTLMASARKLADQFEQM